MHREKVGYKGQLRQPVQLHRAIAAAQHEEGFMWLVCLIHLLKHNSFSTTHSRSSTSAHEKSFKQTARQG